MKFYCEFGTLTNEVCGNVTTPTLVQVLEEYWKEWKLNKAVDINPVRFMFSDDDKKVQGILSAEFGEGWKASLTVVDTVRGVEWCRRVV